MATVLELYERTNRINDIKGSTPISRKRNVINTEFALLLERSPNVFVDIEVTHFDESVDLITMVVDDLVELDVLKQDDKRLMTDSDLIGAGDLVFWQDKYWLVFLEDDITVGDYYKFRIKPCNIRLKWILPNGTISGGGLGIPCAARNQTLYSLGVHSANYVIETPNAKMSIDLPNNPEVQSIIRGNKFYVEGDVFYATMTDRVTYTNVLHMLLGQDELNTQTEVDEINDKLLHNTEIEIINTDGVIDMLVSDSIQLLIETKHNGEIVDNPSIVYTSSDDAIATVDDSGLIIPFAEGTVTITADAPSAESSESFTLNVVSTVTDNWSNHIIGDNVIIVSESKLYQGKFYLNGVEPTVNGTWYLTNLDDTPTDFAEIVVVDDECTITANNYKNEQVKLKYERDADPSIYSEMIITIKGIF